RLALSSRARLLGLRPRRSDRLRGLLLPTRRLGLLVSRVLLLPLRGRGLALARIGPGGAGGSPLVLGGRGHRRRADRPIDDQRRGVLARRLVRSSAAASTRLVTHGCHFRRLHL